jgi:hypothetical protein
MIAETKGVLSEIGAVSPFLNFTSGVLSEIFPGLHSLVVNPGINRYSLKVLEISFKICAILRGRIKVLQR